MEQGASGVRPPQRRPAAGADTVRALQEFTVTVETASPQVDVLKDRDGARTLIHKHTHTHKGPELSCEPSSPPRNLGGGILSSVSLSSPIPSRSDRPCQHGV